MVRLFLSCGHEQRFAFHLQCHRWSFLAGALEESLAHLSDAERFKASMALNREFMSPDTSERVQRAVQSLHSQSLTSAAALIDALLDGDVDRPELA